MFSANNIDQSIGYFYATERLNDFVSLKNNALRLKYAIWLVEIMTLYMQRQSSYKVHMNTISNGELSDPLCDSVNRGLTLVRLRILNMKNVLLLPYIVLNVYHWLLSPLSLYLIINSRKNIQWMENHLQNTWDTKHSVSFFFFILYSFLIFLCFRLYRQYSSRDNFHQW